MSSTTSSSSATSLFSGLRTSGLMSGLDTETIVKEMASATKNKINSQQQKLDLIEWKQEAYRDVITKINTFKSTYLDSLNKDTNIKSNYLMSSYSSVSSNSKIAASASSNALAAEYSITNIAQAAKGAELTSDYGTGAITNGIKMNFSGAENGTDYVVSVTLDGLQKDISFTGGDDASLTRNNFNSALESAFGSNTLSVDNDDNLKYTGIDTISHSFIVEGAVSLTGSYDEQAESLGAIGIDTLGASNKITSSSRLCDINFATPLNGDTYSVEINGTTLTFKSTDTIKQVTNIINNDTNADVTLIFDSLAQKFTLKSDSDGQASSLKISQKSGNLLNALFGSTDLKDGGIGSVSLKSEGVVGAETDVSNYNDYKNLEFSVTINGVTKKIGLWGYDSNGVKVDYADVRDDSGNIITNATDNVIKMLNYDLHNKFLGTSAEFSIDDAGRISLKSSDVAGSISIKVADTEDSDKLLTVLGFDAGVITTNEITDDLKISDLLGGLTGEFSVGGTAISINSDTTAVQLKNMLQSGGAGDFDLDSGVIIINSAVTASDDNKVFVETLFKESYETLSAYSQTGSTDTYEANGQNAIITINGTTITNATNEITIDGTILNIGKLTDTDIAAINSGEEVNISTARDTTKAYDAVIKFVDDYNKLIEELNKTMTTKRPKSNGEYYSPLTEEQRDKMSDTEQEKWDEKAKIGLLYGDNEISKFLTNIRTAMNTRTDDNFSLVDMGISISSYYKDNGKLIVNDSALKAAFAENPDKIQQLFTDTQDGLAANFENAINKSVSTNRSGYGSLTMLAGTINTTTETQNELSNRIASYQKIIANLQDNYENELDRYWSKFTYLETMMSQYNSQSSLFSSQS